MGKGHKYIFSDTECLDLGTMQQYASGKLSNTDQQQVERHLIDCPLCSDALEGISILDSSELKTSVNHLNTKIQEKSSITQPLIRTIKKFSYPIAAVIFLFACSTALILIRNTYQPEPLISDSELITGNKDQKQQAQNNLNPEDSTPESTKNEINDYPPIPKEPAESIEVNPKGSNTANTNTDCIIKEKSQENPDRSTIPVPSDVFVSSEEPELEEIEMIEDEEDMAFDIADAIQSQPEEMGETHQKLSQAAPRMYSQEENMTKKTAMETMDEPILPSATSSMAMTDTLGERLAGESLPEFPGGEIAMRQFINDRLKIEPQDLDDRTKTKIFIQFTVQENGELEDIKVIKGISDKVDTKMVKIFEEMQNWKPFYINGKPISQQYTYPIILEFR